MNRAVLIGHLASAVEIREREDGGRTANFTVETGRDAEVEACHDIEEPVARNSVFVTDEILISLAEKLPRGTRVHVEGFLATRYWVDKRNIERYSTEVVVRPPTGKLELIEDRSPERPASAGRKPPTQARP